MVFAASPRAPARTSCFVTLAEPIAAPTAPLVPTATHASTATPAARGPHPPRRRAALGIAVTLVAAVSSAAPRWAAAAESFELTVVVSGARSAQGQVSLALYDSERGWLETMLRGERTAAAERCVFVFRGLPAGTYALAAFHDENANGKLDRNVVGMPTEALGFSRDAAASFGPPKFADAAIALREPTTLHIKLQ